MGKPPKANLMAQGKVLKGHFVFFFPLCVCFPRRLKLCRVETFSLSLVVPHSSLMCLRLMPFILFYFFIDFPQWGCHDERVVFHISGSLLNIFLTRQDPLLVTDMTFVKLAIVAKWCLASNFPQGTIVFICSGRSWCPANRGPMGCCRLDIGLDLTLSPNLLTI